MNEREEALRRLGPLFVHREAWECLSEHFKAELERCRVLLEKAEKPEEMYRIQGSIKQIKSSLDLYAKFREVIHGR